MRRSRDDGSKVGGGCYPSLKDTGLLQEEGGDNWTEGNAGLKVTVAREEGRLSLPGPEAQGMSKNVVPSGYTQVSEEARR